MSILCRIGIHRWKIVQRYVAEGFKTYFFGVQCISHHEYKGERCTCCHKWRKETAFHWWQWLSIAFLACFVGTPVVVVGGWLALIGLVLVIVCAVLFVGAIFMLCI